VQNPNLWDANQHHASLSSSQCCFLYTLTILNLKNCITARLFADDVKIYLEITGHEDVVRLQKALDVITAWASECQLSVTLSICNLLTVGPSCYEADYYISGTQLTKCAICRDLGITITSHLTSTQHIHDIVLKAHQIRCLISGDITLLVKAFTVYLRPILEYNSITWSPCTKKKFIK